MNSIRKKLLFSILSVLMLVTSLLAVATYFSMRFELDELYDENMKQIAVILTRTGLEDGRGLATNDNKRTLKGEEEFLIQEWRDGTLKHTSHPKITFPLQTQEGHGNIDFNGRVWRFYHIRLAHEDIQVAQDLRKRHGVIAEISHVLIIPILVQFPVLAGLIWMLISYGFKPLVVISGLIQKRTASFLDPLDEKNIPEEITALVSALNDLLDRLKTALEIQRRFTADAAHELRTPLAALRLQVAVLRRASGTEEKEEALYALESGVNRSIRLAQQLLELARQEPGNEDIPFGPVAIASVIEEAIAQIVPFSALKNIRIEKNLEPVPVLSGEANRLGIMINNLINNAVTYTPDGGRVTISLKQTGNAILLEVADNGIGIGEDHMDRIFDRFYRVAGTGATGSGLGLSIVKNIAAIHGATVTVSAGPGGKGTTFRVTFPSFP